MENNNNILALNHYLEHINRCLISLSFDTKKLIMALQAAAKTNCNASKGVINIIALPSLLAACISANAKLIASDDSSGYYRDLSKNVSGQASRNILAFFVPDNSSASQAITMPSSTAPKAHLSATREHSLISIANHLLTDYDGLTLQNTKAERQICRAVTNVTESKTRHPIPLLYSVALTQKTLGGYHHA